MKLLEGAWPGRRAAVALLFTAAGGSSGSSIGCGSSGVGGATSHGGGMGGVAGGEAGGASSAGGANAGAAGASGNCLEIRIGGNLPIGVDPPWTADFETNEVIGVDTTRLHVLFGAGNVASAEVNASAVFRADNGASVSVQVLTPFDQTTPWQDLPGYGSAWGETGTFAVGAHSGVYLGAATSPSLSLVRFVDPEVWAVYSVLWDGEAFAIHMKQGGSTCPLGVARVRPDGTVALPVTPYGTSCATAVSLGREVLATDAPSGRTFVVDAAFSLVLNGHDKTGAPLWPGGAKVIASVRDAYNPAVSADPDGAFVVTSPEPDTDPSKLNPPRVFRVHPDGTASDPITLPLPPLESTSSDFAVASSSATDAWFVVNTRLRMYVTDLTGGQLSAPRVLLDSGVSVDEEQADDTKYKGKYILVGPMQAYNAGGRRWLAFQDASAGIIRLLRVDDPSCVYPTLGPAAP